MGLYLDIPQPQFEKIGMPVRLSESPEAWQRDIAGEIYKQLPFLGDYAVNVILDRVDPQRGYGFGSAEVMNKSEAPLPDQEKLPTIKIPIIIRDYLMAPLDIFLDGKGVFPLSEERVREKLFRSDTFELSTRKPTDKGLVDQLYPPMRTNNGMGSLGADSMGLGKYASLIEAIAPTISDEDMAKFASQVASDPFLKDKYFSNETFGKLATSILGTTRVSTEKTASALVEAIVPTVVQFEKLSSGEFKVKWANVNAYKPQSDVVDPITASTMAGTDLSKMQPGSTLTISTKNKGEAMGAPEWTQVEGLGLFKVRDMNSDQDIVGWAIPIIDMEGDPMEMYTFVGVEPEGVWSVQDEIAGQPAGEADLSQFLSKFAGQPPQGSGAFVSSSSSFCLPPLTVEKMVNGPSGNMIVAQNIWGETVTLHTGNGVREVMPMGDMTYSIPDDMVWVPLEGEPTFLAKNPLDIDSVTQAQEQPGNVFVSSNGNNDFSLQGQPISKLATSDTKFIKKADAEFLLVAMGMDPFEAKTTLRQANSDGHIKIASAITVTPLASLHEEMIGKAISELSDFPYHLKQDLLKEAATLDDADTADKVLSMNFINPENISTFAKYLPELDQTAKKLAELLLASRLGMGVIDEGAIERSMKALEQVIEGLKQLQQNAIDSNS